MITAQGAPTGVQPDLYYCKGKADDLSDPPIVYITGKGKAYISYDDQLLFRVETLIHCVTESAAVSSREGVAQSYFTPRLIDR